MRKTNDPVRSAVARVAFLSRRDLIPDPARLDAARTDLKTAQLERAIRTAMESEPLPSPEQLARLAALLTGGAL